MISIFKDNNEGVYFANYGDEYFINGGNHRTTVAKFLKIKEFEVPFTEYFFDEEFYKLYQDYIDLNLKVEIQSYTRESGCTIVINNKNIYLSNFLIVKSF